MARSPNPEFKEFKPIPFYRHSSPVHYVTHMMSELGRLGMDIFDLVRHGEGEGVLGEVISWIDDPGYRVAKIFNYQSLNLDLLQERRQRSYTRVKPRITIGAYITSKDNLSVVWQPTGWNEHHWDAERKRTQCDFVYFGNDQQSFQRPENELLFFHGVANLHPERPQEDYGHWTAYNKPVVDAILISAVRACYENLIHRLEHNFEVKVQSIFVFEKEAEHGVGKWSLEDAREHKYRLDKDQLDRTAEACGFTIEEYLKQVEIASAPINGKPPVESTINTRVARNFTRQGFKTTPARVEYMRALIGRCQEYEKNPYGE